MLPELVISLFGHVEIKRKGALVEGFVSAKVQALLVFLAATGRPHRRETLAGLLWGDKPDDKARANLRKALSNLRQLVGEFLTITDETVVFTSHANCVVDTQAFELALAQAETSGSLHLLRQAVELYQGDFLAGFTVKNAQEFEDWALTQRERLRQLAVQALHRLMVAYTTQGEYAAGIDCARQLLALEPWQEETHRQLILLLARSGQREAALLQFETCRRILAEELGVSPLPETEALYRRIKAGGQPTPHNLPPQATPFLGRQLELAQIAHHLDQPDCRLLTLTGAGGIGKTRLALQAAGQHLAAFPDGVFFVSLAGVTSADMLAPTIAQAVNISLSGHGHSRPQLVNHLSAMEMLLVLDNFEHLLAPGGALAGGTELVASILAGAPKVKLLITSRERLNLREEWLLEVDGLTVPAASIPQLFDHLGEYPAVMLFDQHARRLYANFSLSPENMTDVIRICRLVGGMPLGLELAAAWTPLLSCADIAAEIERDTNFLEISTRNVPDRHRSIRAVFESSWALLSGVEQETMLQLSVFRGGFQREAAVRVTGASLPLLLGLMHKSLLRRDAQGRYEMHELLLQFAAEKLREMSSRPDAPVTEITARTRHSDYYLAFLRQRKLLLLGAGQPETLAEISDALENIQVAWRWVVDQGDFDGIELAAPCLFLFCETRSRFQEGQALCRYALDALQQTNGSSERSRILGKLLTHQGQLLYNRGVYPEAKIALNDGLTLCRQHNQTDYVAQALYTLGLVAVMQGDYPEARRFSQESLNLYTLLDKAWGQAWALYTLGWAAYYLGQYEPAQLYTRQSLELHRAIGNGHGEAACLNTLGLIVCALYEFELAEHPEAREFFEQNLAIRRAIGDGWGEAIALHNLGYIHCKLSDYAGASAWFEASLSISKVIGAQHMIAATGMWLGVAALEQGDYARARLDLIEAFKIGYENKALGRVTDVLYRLGDLLGREGQVERAVEYLTLVQYHPATDDRVREGATLLLAELLRQLPAEARTATQVRGQSRSLEDVAGDLLLS